LAVRAARRIGQYFYVEGNFFERQKILELRIKKFALGGGIENRNDRARRTAAQAARV